MLRIGHRGAAGYEPENTLASFKKALQLRVDGIEFDVHLSQDGKIVVMHDNKVDRTTNGKGLKVFVWTVNDEKEIEKMKMMGVDGIFSDYPDRIG